MTRQVDHRAQSKGLIPRREGIAPYRLRRSAGSNNSGDSRKAEIANGEFCSDRTFQNE
jgi:hypothetical protein